MTVFTRVSLQENVWSFLPDSQNKVAVLTRWLYYRGGRKAGFHCINVVLGRLFMSNLSWNVRYNYFKNGIVINNVLIALATITNVSSDKALLEGSDLQLFCIASGRPTPNITWVKITSSGGESDVLHRGTTWDFRNISRTDDGTYRCTASNGVGNPARHTLQVNVECEYMTAHLHVLRVLII